MPRGGPNVAGTRFKGFPRLLKQLLAEKSLVLSKAHALLTMGLKETAQPLWAEAAVLEERIASLLDAHADNLEAAVHRISAASCYSKAGNPSRAVTLYQAALAGPLRANTRMDVEAMLKESLAALAKSTS
jgi:hypothetical protein